VRPLLSTRKYPATSAARLDDGLQSFLRDPGLAKSFDQMGVVFGSHH